MMSFPANHEATTGLISTNCTCPKHSFILIPGLPPLRTQGCGTPPFPFMSGRTSPGGATLSNTQEAPAAGPSAGGED